MKSSSLFGILLGAALLLLGATSLAQIEISWDEYKLDVGTLFEQETAGDTVEVDLGSPGGPQVWDFTSQVTPIAIGFVVVSPESTPFADGFSTANFVLESFILDGLIQWQYHQVTPTYSEFQGWGYRYPDTSFYIKFSPPRKIPLPLHYGLSWYYRWGWVDTIEVGPPLWITTHSFRGRQAVDGYGTVRIPLGEYETLRLCTFDTCTTISTVGGDTLSADTSTHISYSWLSEGFGEVVSVASFPGEPDPNFTQAHCFNRLKSFTGAFDEGLTSFHPRGFQLGQNFPNPFNSTTRIGYVLPKEGLVELRVYNTAGQLVKTLVEGIRPPGGYFTVWDGRSDRGSPVSSGVYLYKLTVGDGQLTRKMVILK